jgi:hypothetical protein
MLSLLSKAVLAVVVTHTPRIALGSQRGTGLGFGIGGCGLGLCSFEHAPMHNIAHRSRLKYRFFLIFRPNCMVILN